jgi:integrase
MAIEKLSDTFIRKVTKNGLHADGGNLYLQVTNGGTGKSWLFRWTDRRTKRQRSMGLGTDTATARDKAKLYRQWLSGGKDPWAEREAAKLESDIRAGEAKTLREVVDEFYRAKIAPLSHHRRKNFTRIMEKHVLAKIGDMPIAKVTRNHILDAPVHFRQLWDTKFRTAEVIHCDLKNVFSFAIALNYFGHPAPKNPLLWKDLQHVLPDRRRTYQVKHHDSLPFQDIPTFMLALRAYQDKSVRTNKGRSGTTRWQLHPTLALLVEWIVLTSVRVSEASEATWDEIKDRHGPRPVWAAVHHKIRTITKLPHYVPITKPMLAILDEMERRHGAAPGKLIFPSPYRKNGGRPGRFDTNSPCNFVKDRMNVEKVTAHGFRDTVLNWGIANGYPRDLLDLQIGHIPPGHVAKAYGRDPQVEARRAIMEAYGMYCALPPAADNVVHGTFNRAKEVA